VATAIVTIFITFLLTGLLGNRLLHFWQHRSWLAQQRVLTEEKAHEALQRVFDEASTLAGKRQHRMFRLMHGLLRNDDDALRQRVADYDEATVAWNERLVALFAQIEAHAAPWLRSRLENELQPMFVVVGADLEKMARERLAGKGKISSAEIKRIVRRLNKLQREIFLFEVRVIGFMKDRRRTLIREVELSPYNLNRLPTWKLFKALFQGRVQGDEIV
jgi:hypothetical protein